MFTVDKSHRLRFLKTLWYVMTMIKKYEETKFEWRRKYLVVWMTFIWFGIGVANFARCTDIFVISRILPHQDSFDWTADIYIQIHIYTYQWYVYYGYEVNEYEFCYTLSNLIKIFGFFCKRNPKRRQFQRIKHSFWYSFVASTLQTIILVSKGNLF